VLKDYDVVIDLVGDEVRARSYRVLRNGGILVWVIGRSVSTDAVPGRKEIRTVQALIHDDIEVLRAAGELASQGKLKPQVASVLPLEEAVRAHELVQKGQHGQGRLVLDIRGQASQRPASRSVV